jgi:MerR family transcriptional regulator, light-induced transcriptional regulator
VTELQAVVLADAGALPVAPAQAAASSAESPDSVRAAALRAVERFDAVELESTLRGAVLRLGVDQLLDEVIAPLLFTIGSKWQEGHMRPAHEHLASAVIRRTLSWLIAYAAPPASAPTVVVATLAGQTHEFGALLAAATAVSQGWRVVYLGTSLPAAEIAAAAIETRATAVALSLVYPADDPAIPHELRDLRAALPPGCAIVAGGGATPDYMAALATVGASRFATTGEFRIWLRQATSTR